LAMRGIVGVVFIVLVSLVVVSMSLLYT